MRQFEALKFKFQTYRRITIERVRFVNSVINALKIELKAISSMALNWIQRFISAALKQGKHFLVR